ncbi:RagB/SusD family nutrient uptake outer membrane protein [Puteibacter caeruleilacunae]|nr:RagB/SusD family nutrient uptake outer membrane protein [Puteibacter caeruleilacunae]
MKINKTYIIYLLAGIMLASCSDLDYTPESNLLSGSFYKSESDLNAAVMGAYKDFAYPTFMNHHMYQYVMGDDISTRTNKDNRIGVDQFNPPADNVDSFYERTWKDYWQAIYNVNVFLENTVETELSEDIITSYTAQMRFLRGLSYFYLVRNFGGVPLITASANSGKESRSSVLEIYEFIEEDLKYCEQHLPANWGNEYGRPSLGAAKALLAQLYLTWAGWPVKDEAKYKSARDKSAEVMQMGYALVDNFEDLWKKEESYDNNSESIFQIMFSEVEFNSGAAARACLIGQSFFPEDRLDKGVPGAKTGWQDHNASIGFFNNFPDDDPRKTATFLTEWKSIDHPTGDGDFEVVNWSDSRYGKPTFKKWTAMSHPLKNHNGIFRDIMIIRYAEVLLMFAEADNEVNGPTAAAYDAVNQVRNRAFGEGVSPVPTGLSKDDFLEFILNERKLEFAGEGVRWRDMQRREFVKAAIESNTDAVDFQPVKDVGNPNNWIFPLPSQEVTLNPNLEQYFDVAKHVFPQ